MPSSYTPSLRLEIQATGENDTSWGDKTNVNLSAVLEPAIAGAVTIDMENTDYILSVGYGAADESRNAIIICGGINSAPRNVICPATTKLYVVRNLTSGSHPIVFKTATGSGVTVANGDTVHVMCDGSKVVAADVLPDSMVTPSKINTAATNAWRFNGAVGLGYDQDVVPNYGVFGISGTTGSYIPFYVSGAHNGTLAASATAFDMSSLTQPLTFSTSGVVRMTVATGGSVVVAGALSGLTVTATSDETLKHNWNPLPPDIIDQIAAIGKSGTFSWNDGGESIGIGAQSLERILPSAVVETVNGKKSVNMGGAAMAIIVELCREVRRLREKS